MTLPDGAGLGATQDPQALVKGEPAQVDANATALSDEAARVKRLAGDVDHITIGGWAGGYGEPAYAAARSAEQAKWKAYADVLTTASSALSTYAGALRTAQSRAADAIAKWDEGEQATRTAVREYNEAVDAYNSYVSRQVCVPSYGGPVVPSMGPARPGPFVDPGEALRTEAEHILEEARKALDEAGESAVRELGGLPGARTEGSSGPGASGEFHGPSIDWGDWKDTFGKNPSDGKDGRYDHGLGDSPFAINIVKVEGEAHAWGAEGSVEDYWGDATVHAEGKVTVLGVDGGAETRIDSHGFTTEGHAGATLVGAEGKAGGEWGYAEGEVTGSGAVEARAQGDASVGLHGVHAGGELFAGGRAEAGVSGDLGGVGGDVSAEGWAGFGASGDVDLGYHDGKIEVGGSGGLAFGLGGKVGGHITIDPEEIVDTGGDIIDAIGDFLR